MDYHAFAEFARSWGVVYLMAMFFAACAYALWPSNKAKFEKAARMPLDEDKA
jgi:cytochrome c oxidase cbb3-type subunit 4